MNVLLLVLRWVVSLIAVFGGIGVIIYWAMKEDWKLGVVMSPLPAVPALLYPHEVGQVSQPFHRVRSRIWYRRPAPVGPTRLLGVARRSNPGPDATTSAQSVVVHSQMEKRVSKDKGF